MSKKELLPRAEELYVCGNMTYEEIASHLEVSEKTVRNWSSDGNWREKRAQYLERKQSLDHQIYDFTNILMSKIKEDWAAGEEVSDGRLFSLTRLVATLERARKYEHEAKSDEAGERGEQDGLSEEALREIERTIKML